MANGSREFRIAIDMLNTQIKWRTTKSMKEMKKKGEIRGSVNQFTCELGIVSGHYPHLVQGFLIKTITRYSYNIYI